MIETNEGVNHDRDNDLDNTSMIDMKLDNFTCPTKGEEDTNEALMMTTHNIKW